MRKSIFFAGLAAIAAISFSSCSKNEVDTPDTPSTFTHTVTIKAEAPQTRTEIVEVEGDDQATFKWSSDDASRFVIKENNVAATGVSLSLSEGDKKAAIAATFETATASSYEYTAWMSGSKTNSGTNPRISTSQKPTASSYDPNADILVAKSQSFTTAQNELLMQFYRPLVINKMTLKGLTVGSTVSTVKISGDKNIAGSYNTSTESWTGDNTVINVTVNQEVPPSGQVVVYFVTMPVEEVTLSLDVTASDATYSKSFSKTIDFIAGQVTVFGVSGMTSKPSATFEYNYPNWLVAQGIAVPNSGAYTEIGGTTQTVGKISLTSTNGTSPARIHNKDSKYDLRVYKNGGSITLSADDGYVIEKISFNGSGLTNEKMSANCGTYDGSKTTWMGLSDVVTFTALDTWSINTITVAYHAITEDDHFFSVSPASKEVEYNATSAEFTLSKTNIDDIVASSTPEGTAATISGNTLTVSFPENTTNVARDIVVNLSSATGGSAQDKSVIISQAGAPEVVSISSLAIDGNYTVSGQVVGLCTKGFIIADNTGAIFVYTNSDVTSTYTIGQTVSVSGTVSAFNKALQFPQGSSITPGSAGEYTYGTPVEYTINEIETFLNNTSDRLATYVSVSGILEKSSNYYNVKVGSTTSNVTLYAVPSSMMSDVSEGENVTIKGYAMNVSSNKCGILVTEIVSNPSPVLLFDGITNVAAEGVTNATANGTATNVTGWTPSVSYTGCVTAASINSDCTKITYSVGANSEATEKPGTITVTLSKSGETDVVFTINVAQKAAEIGPKTGTITFGSAAGSVKINAASVNGDDDRGNTWTITTEGTTSFTSNASYYQVGSGSKPATSITFTMTLPNTVNVLSLSAKFGGFSGTAGNVSLKVGNNSVGSGSLDGTNDVTVESNTTSTGTDLTVTVSSISKGVKVYNITYTYEDNN